jgi:ethanolamine utilization protein EutJ
VLNRNVADLGIDPEVYLTRAAEGLYVYPGNGIERPSVNYSGPVRVGVDLGTAYTVMTVLDKEGNPLVGEYQFSQVVRDGLVVDYIGAVDLLSAMRERVEARLGRKIDHAASAYPPGVPRAEVRATANVVEAAGMQCKLLTDEPSAANLVLGLKDGVIVDVGGGTTGVAIVENGKIVHTADEPTGGTHFSLVIAGALDISFEEAEELKKNPAQQTRLFPLVRPVMEKVGVIVNRNMNGSKPKKITLVGGTALFPGIDEVVQEVTGIPTMMPSQPMFVTPLGIAWQDTQELEE